MAESERLRALLALSAWVREHHTLPSEADIIILLRRQPSLSALTLSALREWLQADAAPAVPKRRRSRHPRLTSAQQRVLVALHRLSLQKGYPPTVRELRDDLGLHSTNAVVCHLTLLEKKGYVVRDKLRTRSLRLTPRAVSMVSKAAVAE